MEKNKKNSKGKRKINLEKLKNNKKTIILFLVSCIIIFCIYKVILFVKNPTDTFTVQQGNIYQEEKTTGYIIREETIVKGSNYKNGMEQIKTEGERVAKGEAIFRYYSSGEENLVSKIKDLDVRIDEALSKETTVFTSSDAKALEKQIENQIMQLRKENSIQNINKTKKEISNNIVKKAKIAGDYSASGSYLKKLIDERSKYENQLNSGAEYVNSPVSGAVSYKVDGYEEVLSTNDFSKINVKFLENLNLKTGQLVSDSKESAKIINNFECYIACVLSTEQAMNAELDQAVKIRLSNHEEIEGIVKYISKEENKVVIIFKVDEQVQELVSYRKISFDIIWWSYNGKKIPNSAIGFETKNENQVAYITRTRNGYQDKVLIKILRQNDKYSIVDNYTSEELKNIGYTSEEIKSRKTLTLYDEILKNPT